MPGPSFYVVLTDAHGDEWEVRVMGTAYTVDEVRRMALAESDRLAGIEPRWQPVAPLTVERMEFWNAAELAREEGEAR